MWKLPLFGVGDPEEVLAEIDACLVASPGCWIKVVGYDPKHGGLGTAFLVAQPAD
jgi:ribulose-bisphosphate carboxylase small chain